ncbi:MAG: hypothetical protein Q9216_006027 [Gyalolechia sp. 2 TL-2023]
MSTSNQSEQHKFFFPAVSKPTFLGLVWGSTGVSAIFLLFRACVRLIVFRRFFADDGLLLLGWIVLLVSTALWQSMIDDLYLIFSIAIGAIEPPADFLSILWRYFRRTFAVTLLNIFCLWFIKASFLAFFYKLGHHVRGQKIVWWTAAVAWFIGLALSVGVANYKCVIGSPEEAIAACSTKSYGEFIYRALRLQAACDVITDAFIMAIPIRVLWDVQISPRSKAALLVLFSLTLFTMIVAIIRVTLSLRHEREDDSWIYVWAAIEPAVGKLPPSPFLTPQRKVRKTPLSEKTTAFQDPLNQFLRLGIIIACIISYRALLTQGRKSSGYTRQTDHKRLAYDTATTANSHGNVSRVQAGKISSDSSLKGKEEAVPLDAIRVRREYDVLPSLELSQGVERGGLK